MSYYNRPMGDYATYGYAGDPGWLSAIWAVGKSLFKKKVTKEILRPLGTAVATGVATGAVMQAGGKAPQPPPGSIGGAISFPGGTSVSAAFVLPSHAAMGEHAPAGYHLDKATRSRWVRNRRMNVANPRALRKAMRRVQGFEKLAKRTISFTRRVKIRK